MSAPYVDSKSCYSQRLHVSCGKIGILTVPTLFCACSLFIFFALFSKGLQMRHTDNLLVSLVASVQQSPGNFSFVFLGQLYKCSMFQDRPGGSTFEIPQSHS